MQKRFLALTFLTLFALAAALSATVPTPGGIAAPATATSSASSAAPALPFTTPKPTPRITCDLLYQYCLRNYCTPGDSNCETACLCQYYSCQGMDLPNECIY